MQIVILTSGKPSDRNFSKALVVNGAIMGTYDVDTQSTQVGTTLVEVGKNLANKTQSTLETKHFPPPADGEMINWERLVAENLPSHPRYTPC